jgi:hypothetical protein
VLAATSHRVADLEVYHVQADEGPCIDTIRTGVVVEEAGAERIVARWPVTGPVLVADGDLFTSLDEALEARAVVERAKGALAHVRSIALPSDFDALLELAATEHVTLGEPRAG